jgi:hypothetical protein
MPAGVLMSSVEQPASGSASADAAASITQAFCYMRCLLPQSCTGLPSTSMDEVLADFLH